VLLAEKPVHLLLAGPPALAKSLCLWDIERVYGEQAIWLVGSATSKAGFWDLVAEREPRIPFIDELDKMSAADTAGIPDTAQIKCIKTYIPVLITRHELLMTVLEPSHYYYHPTNISISASFFRCF
jgi:hypothetical protein